MTSPSGDTPFSQSDREWMARALQLAALGRDSTSPNPRVGCVLTRNDQLLAEGWHQWAGEGHAEVNALAQVEDASGATAYVTLEPCSHQGKTPPCADALIRAGVSRVVVAMSDPNPLVAGRGLARLQETGIKVSSGLLEAQARELNKGFVRRMEGGLPWLRAKSAMSLDGRTAMASGESQWITGADARADVQRLRAQSCAIVSGVETVVMDNAALTVRPESFGGSAEQRWRQPLRVIVDGSLRTPPSAKLFDGGGEIVFATASQDATKREALAARGAGFIDLAGDDQGRLAPEAVMMALAERGCNEVLLEAGANLVGSFLQAGLVDEWFVYMAPCLMGSAGRPLAQWPMATMAEQQALEVVDIRAVGRDWRIHCKPAMNNE